MLFLFARLRKKERKKKEKRKEKESVDARESRYTEKILSLESDYGRSFGLFSHGPLHRKRAKARGLDRMRRHAVPHLARPIGCRTSDTQRLSFEKASSACGGSGGGGGAIVPRDAAHSHTTVCLPTHGPNELKKGPKTVAFAAPLDGKRGPLFQTVLLLLLLASARPSSEKRTDYVAGRGNGEREGEPKGRDTPEVLMGGRVGISPVAGFLRA